MRDVATMPRLPRIVLVTRKSPLTRLIEHHGTAGQVRFFLETLGHAIDPYEEAHARLEAGVDRVLAALCPEQRRTRVDREELDRFLFSPDDVVVVVGQDGLVANTAKYLAGQLLVGVNPDPDRYDGILCRHAPGDVDRVLDWMQTRDDRFAIESRTLVEARREDGARIVALNEVFVGHRSHQSARYQIRVGDREESQSSSGLLCASGTGSTGWVRSIVEQRRLEVTLPGPVDPRLAWFVREPFPSVATGTDLDFGILDGADALTLVSRMGEGGVCFGDGIESDAVEFLDGRTLRLGMAEERLQLVIPG